MYINKGKRDILIFPKFENINKIQELRNKYDPLSDLIAPHITIVFPFSDNISNEELIKKLTNLLKDFKPLLLYLKEYHYLKTIIYFLIVYKVLLK